MGQNRRSQYIIKALGLMALIVLFQNCAPKSPAINDELKTQILTNTKLFIPPPSNEEAKLANFTFICPQPNSANSQDLIHSKELKAVVEFYDFENNTSNTLCEVHDVRKQILDSRSVDLSSCSEIPSLTDAHLNLYIVPESVTSDFSAHKLNTNTSPNSLGGNYAINYLTMTSATGSESAACDEAGAPLMIQLPTNITALSFTSPSDGILLDLLGQKSYPTSHEKVLSAWLTNHSANDVFMLVKPNKDHLVLGADEMFSDATLGPDANFAKQGFAALAKYDENKDLLLDEDDRAFHELRLWQDQNQDGIAQDTELSTLSEHKIVAIDLRFETRYRESDAYNNQSRNKSVIIMEDQSYGLIFDLWLRFIHTAPQITAAPRLPAAMTPPSPAAAVEEPTEIPNEAAVVEPTPIAPEEEMAAPPMDHLTTPPTEPL